MNAKLPFLGRRVNDAFAFSPWKNVKLSLLLLIVMGFTVQAFDDGAFVIPPKSDPPPAVDGQLNEWINRPGAFKLDRREQVTLGGSSWKSTTDLSARAWLAWRDDLFHFAISVTDDQLRYLPQRGSGFLGDHVKLFLDVAPENEPSRATFGNGQFEIVFSPGNFLRTNQTADCAPAIYINGTKFDGGKIAATQTPDGYDIEAALPWSQLGVTTPSNGSEGDFGLHSKQYADHW